MKKLYKLTLVALCASIFFVMSIATSIATEKRALQKLAVIAVLMEARGWDFRDKASGDYLSEGESYVIRTTLLRGNTYKIIAAGDDSVEDLDIILYDENANEIDRDTQTDSLPVVDVAPKWTGVFYIKIKMYKGSGHSKFVVFYQ